MRLALTLRRCYPLFKFSLVKQVGIATENSHLIREVYAVLLVHSTFVNGSRSECAGFELVNESRLATEKVELI